MSDVGIIRRTKQNLAKTQEHGAQEGKDVKAA
jgi:hypothetical protein